VKVAIYNWTSALDAHRQQWSEWVASRPYNPSLHPEWLDATLRAWGLDKSAAVAVIESGDRVRAIVPFLVRDRTIQGLPCRALELCSNVFSYHAEVLCDGDLGECLEHFLASKDLPRWDVFRAVNVATDGLTARAIKALPSRVAAAFSVRSGETSPYVSVDRDWNSYLSTRTKKVRANISRARRLMKDAGETGVVWYENGCDPKPLLAAILEIEAQSWKADAGVAILTGTPQGAYYERLLPWLAVNGIRANVLYVKERPVAYVLCAVWKGWVGQLKTSFAAELPDAGFYMIQMSLQRSIEGGCKEYDFLGDVAPHKMRWADHTRAHEDLWVFSPHLRGRALGAVKRVADSVNRWRERRRKAVPST